ncbi:MAG: PocR ligand-binding domain-containing protein [Anaerolineae bacterium]|nr:PocR ligand-binding domain-containing protein [Anaerolineae bacterium]
MDTLLTVRQLQDLLQVDRITIYRMLDDGRLRGFKVGGQWRFSRQAIESWLHEQQSRLEALEPPGMGAAGSPLRPSPNALPLSCIQAIQDIFAQALGIAAVTTTVDGTPIIPIANSCTFCNLILDTNAGRQRCTSSWRAAAAQETPALSLATESASQFTTCHAGLRYAWSRIEVEGQFVAAVHAGQFLDRSPDEAGRPVDLAELAAATKLQVQELQAALATVPVLDPDRQRQVTHLLQRMAATLSEIGTERLNLLSRLQRIAEITGY